VLAADIGKVAARGGRRKVAKPAQLPPAPPRESFTFGVVTVVPENLAAVCALFDEEYKAIPASATDTNMYNFGRMGNVNVIVSCLPAGVTGTISCAAVTANMRRSFPELKQVALVGVGGGAPTPDDPERDIRLGDVIVSRGDGVIQHDMMALYSGKKELKKIGGALDPPGVGWMTAVAKFQRFTEQGGTSLKEYTACVSAGMFSEESKRSFGFPTAPDALFDTKVPHAKNNKRDCKDCDNKLVKRADRNGDPRVFYGVMASSSSAMTTAAIRDKYRDQILCWETEAAGMVANQVQYLIIRGVSHYCDGHINKAWERYAASRAAAFFRCLVDFYTPPQEIPL
jgi:nucleoside phosphorylase